MQQMFLNAMGAVAHRLVSSMQAGNMANLWDTILDVAILLQRVDVSVMDLLDITPFEFLRIARYVDEHADSIKADCCRPHMLLEAALKLDIILEGETSKPVDMSDLQVHVLPLSNNDKEVLH
jgi:hypothetical protein